MKEFEIYQISDKCPNARYYRFANLDCLSDCSLSVSLENYERVYKGETEYEGTDLEICEKIYMDFQGVKPKGYTGYSVSVSDLVRIGRSYYYCDSFEFVPIKLD